MEYRGILCPFYSAALTGHLSVCLWITSFTALQVSPVVSLLSTPLLSTKAYISGWLGTAPLICIICVAEYVYNVKQNEATYYIPCEPTEIDWTCKEKLHNLIVQSVDDQCLVLVGMGEILEDVKSLAYQKVNFLAILQRFCNICYLMKQAEGRIAPETGNFSLSKGLHDWI